jgi:Ca2+-binding EF-hand superfamily protein
MNARNLALTGVVALALAATGLPTLAQTSAPKKTKEERQAAKDKYEAQFKAADTNGDGGLSKEELSKSKDHGVIMKNFDAMDTDKDGKVTMAEHRAWLKAKAADRKKQKQ